MGLLAWVIMGLAIWHFTIWLPDRFWAGIIGAFIGSVEPTTSNEPSASSDQADGDQPGGDQPDGGQPRGDDSRPKPKPPPRGRSRNRRHGRRR